MPLRSADLCILTQRRLAEITEPLDTLGFPIIEGPVPRTGATGPMLSIYRRDPDGALIEIARLQSAHECRRAATAGFSLPDSPVCHSGGAGAKRRVVPAQAVALGAGRPG